MKKSVLNLGIILNKKEQRSINGKDFWLYERCILMCERLAEKHTNFNLENCYLDCNNIN